MAQPKSHTRHALVRSSACVSLFTLALAACSGGSDTTETQPTHDTASEQAATDTTPDMAAADVEAMAASPEVSQMGYPFGEVPAADEAFFIDMSDGVRLAANLYFPPGASRTTPSLPALYVDEWYGRADEATGTAIELYRDAGFVVALVDARGYGASFGAQPAFTTERSRTDQVEVLDWLAAQPWSNGRVGTAGLSLSGSLAGVMTGSGSPHLGAAVIRSADFDQYTTNLFPGGVPNVNMLEGFAGFTQKMRGQACIEDLAACALLGVQPVAADEDYSLLQAAFREHATNADAAVLRTAEYRDDTIGTGAWPDMTPHEHPSVRVPTRLVASWVDGLTADSALLRFASHPNTPMQLLIGASSHMGGLDGDPFARTPFASARPEPQRSFGDDIAFVQRALSGGTIGRSIEYLVLGTDRWLTTDVWPPAGSEAQKLALTTSRLVQGLSVADGEAPYDVDPSTSTGPYNRWASQRAAPIHYGDRRQAPGRALSFDAMPVDVDTEIVGTPELCIAMTTDQTDGIILAYLEDVAPDGRVTYLTEGQLRLLHRATRGQPCDPAPGADRSFEHRDAQPVTPGEHLRFEIPFAATAALLAQGHHLRLSLAGADAGTFPTLTDSPAHWTVRFGGPSGSTLRVPSRPWSEPDAR
jgi:uncharacterized protein